MDNQIIQAISMLIPLILSLTVHEYSHARAAEYLGDDTAKNLGRRTLNPIPHIDPIGTVALPLMGLMFGGFIFGWAKPVPVNPIYFTRKFRMKTGMLLVAAAGPFSNMVLAVLASATLFVLHNIIGYNLASDPFNLATLLYMMIRLNVILAFFNLLPIPPLDGGHILAGFLPDSAMPYFESLQRYGFMFLIFLMFTGALQVLFIPAGKLADFLFYWPLG